MGRKESDGGRGRRRETLPLSMGSTATGLRLQEWSSVLVSELRQPSGDSNNATLDLADACAKGCFGADFKTCIGEDQTEQIPDIEVIFYDQAYSA